jgi:hypothetical protein
MSTRYFRGMVIAAVAFAVSHALCNYKIITFAVFRVAARRMDDNGSVVVDRSRVRHHFRCTSSIDSDERIVAG